MNELVKTIQQLAKAQGKTIKDVAREAGVGENAIYRWSTNEPKISTNLSGAFVYRGRGENNCQVK